jgi:hypothetical protein
VLVALRLLPPQILMVSMGVILPFLPLHQLAAAVGQGQVQVVYLAVLVVVVEQIAVLAALVLVVKVLLAGLVALNLVAMLLAVAAVLLLLGGMQPLP